MSIKWAEKIQVSMAVIKLVAAGIIMAGGFYSLAQGIDYYKTLYSIILTDIGYWELMHTKYAFSVLP